MRIITGTARGTVLEALPGMDITRPTADRTKEGIFNTLQFDIEGRQVLDLFGGSGQLSLEALSRGAAGAYICDSSAEAIEVIKRNARKTHLFEKTRIVCCDYMATLNHLRGREKFDIIFLDPPYDSPAISKALKKIVEGDLLSDYGVIVCESDRKEPFTAEGLKIKKHCHYGKAYITYLEKASADEEFLSDKGE